MAQRRPAGSRHLEHRYALIGASLRLTALDQERSQILSAFPELYGGPVHLDPALLVPTAPKKAKKGAHKVGMSERMREMWNGRPEAAEADPPKKSRYSAASLRKMRKAAKLRWKKAKAAGLSKLGPQPSGLPPTPRAAKKAAPKKKYKISAEARANMARAARARGLRQREENARRKAAEA